MSDATALHPFARFYTTGKFADALLRIETNPTVAAAAATTSINTSCYTRETNKNSTDPNENEEEEEEVYIEEIRVHRLVLASQSPYFDRLFSRKPDGWCVDDVAAKGSWEATSTLSSSLSSSSSSVVMVEEETKVSSGRASVFEESENWVDAEEAVVANGGGGASGGKVSASGSTSLVGKFHSSSNMNTISTTSAINISTSTISNPSSTSTNAINGGGAQITDGKKVLNLGQGVEPTLGVWKLGVPDEVSLRLVLEWFYFGDLDLDLYNVWGVLTLAREFQVPCLAARVDGFLEGVVSSSAGYASSSDGDGSREGEGEVRDGLSVRRRDEMEWEAALVGALRVEISERMFQKLVDASVRDLLLMSDGEESAVEPGKGKSGNLGVHLLMLLYIH
jgi:hypothetical protein